jgi:hypothetical protein
MIDGGRRVARPRVRRGLFIMRIRRQLMTAIGDGFKNIFLAGIGAMAITGEKSKELVDQLVAKGELTVDQGKQIN